MDMLNLIFGWRRAWFGIGALSFLGFSADVPARPFISEFMAENVSVLADEDGDFPDWIEVANPGPGAVDLGGWYLTDDAADLTRWPFPPTLLEGGGRVVVFASGKDRGGGGAGAGGGAGGAGGGAGGELHTSFSLDNDGEFLALVEPDGVTVAARFSPYPAQVADVSYGLGTGSSAPAVELVPGDAEVRFLVPDGPVPPDWRGGAPYDDGGWTSARLGVGFNTGGGPVIGGGGAGEATVAYAVGAGTAGNQDFGGALGMDFIVLQPVRVTALGVFDDGSDGLRLTLRAELWSRDDGGSVENPNDDAGLGVLASLTFTAGDPGALEGGSRFKDLADPLVLQPGAYTMVGHGYGAGERNGNSRGNGDFGSGNDGGGLLGFVGSGRWSPGTGDFPANVDGGPEVRYGAGTFKFSAHGDALIATDLESAMHGRASSALLRVPFEVEDPGAVVGLALEMAYDDGFAAYLNGVPVTSRNAPADPAWDAVATAGGNAVESFDLTASAASLRAGANILALHGLNLGRDDGDFILAPRLTAQVARPDRVFFFTATPGEANGLGYTGSGVVINEIHYDPRSNTAPAEFVELFNAGGRAEELAGWTLAGGIDFAFGPAEALAPGEYRVVALEAEGFAADFGAVPALAPLGGRLSNGGERVELRDGAGALVDRVSYGVGAPWPVAGDAPFPSLQLLHPGLDNDLAGSWRAAAPTPGAPNGVFTTATAAPPQVRQVSHGPPAPRTGEAVTVVCKATDPDGIASVALEYQLVEPGAYIRLDDPEFATGWTQLPMAAGGGDGIYTVTLPGTLQVHRRLVRYRIVAQDALGNDATVPLPSDPSGNFAYFVYDGAPAWRGADVPGQTPVVTYSATVMNALPIYHLISRAEDIEACQYDRAFNDKVYRFEGALVYGDEVYDHIHYRIRGHGSTYNTGKNKWKIRFNRGRFFQGHDNYGRPYPERVRTLNWSALASPWNPANRGMAGLDEALAFRLWQLAGVPAHNLNYFHLRVIDGVAEAGLLNQYEGDNWGLYLALEQADRRFLDARGLPDGNVFNMHFGSSNSLNQARGRPADRSDLFAFTGGGANGYNRNPLQPPTWWEANVELGRYFAYRSVVEAVNHSDLRDQENSILYHNPDSGRWTMIPWDADLLYEEFDRWGPDGVQTNATLEQFRKCLGHPELNRRFQNRARELRDLLLNDDQGWTVVDELVSFVAGPGGGPGWPEIDRARWDRAPPSRSIEGPSRGTGSFFLNPYTSTRFPGRVRTLASADFPGMVRWVKDFIAADGFGGSQLAELARDHGAPHTPAIAYAGEDGFPTDGLAFESSDYSTSILSGSPFAAMEWRLGEVANPSTPGYIPGEPWVYEVDTFWSSGEIAVFQNQFAVPAGAVRENRTYRARVRHKDTMGRWGHWSAPLEFTASPPDVQTYRDGLVITEIMYNPAGGQELEFIELANVGDVALDLSNIRFTKGVDFDFGGSDITVLEPGDRVLVVRDRAAFEAHYGAGLPVAGEYRLSGAGALANGGERIKLSFGAGTAIRDFAYGTRGPWPAEADGGGFSLTLVAPAARPDPADPGNWRSSVAPGGSPGAGDALPFTGQPLGDENGDGVPDLLEYALAEPPAVSFDRERGEALLEFALRPGADDARVEAEFSADLATWSSGADDLVLEGRRRADENGGAVRFRFRLRAGADADGGGGGVFFRLRASLVGE